MPDDLYAFTASMKLTQIAFILGGQIAPAFIVGARHNKLLLLRQRPVFDFSNFIVALPFLRLDSIDLYPTLQCFALEQQSLILKSALYNFLFLNKFLLLGQRRSLRELTYFTLNKKRLTMLAVIVRNKRSIQLRYDESLTPCFMTVHTVRVVGRPQ
jgi:hypothetical protein